MKSLNNIKESIQPTLEAFENYRKEKLRLTKRGELMVIVATLLSLSAFVYAIIHDNEWLIAPLLIVGVSSVLISIKYLIAPHQKSYQNQYKEVIIKAIVHQLYPEVNYQPQACVKRTIVEESSIFNKKWPVEIDMKGENYFFNRTSFFGLKNEEISIKGIIYKSNSSCMKPLLFASILFLYSCKTASVVEDSGTYAPTITKSERASAINECSSLLTQSIYHGANRDELSKEFTDHLIANNALWVGKCPICDNVRKGLKKYQSMAKGSGLPAPYAGVSVKEQKVFLKQMVDDYIKWYSKILKMNTNEMKKSGNCLIEARKVRMGSLKSGDFCASCDGACGK